VHPSLERPLELDVTELSSRLVVTMLGDPAAACETRAHHQYGPVAVVDVPVPLDDLDGGPRRRQTLDRSHALVPAEHLLARAGDVRGVDEDLVRHAWTDREQ
jgi:hypothetical protein